MTADQFDPFSREVLEFSGIIELLSQFLSGPIAEPQLASLAPHTRVDEIRRDLERAAQAREYLRGSPRPGLGSLKDPRAVLEKLRIEGVTLTALEILELVEVARAACDFRSLFAKTPFPRLADLIRDLADFRKLVGELEGKILPDGSLDSSASPALARIRRDIEHSRQELQSALEKLLARLGRDQVLQDAVVTIRNDRLVIPIRAEERRKAPGVVHGASSSGATVYVEPLETVPLNNELVELREKEFAEIQRILAVFSQKLRERRQELQAATEILSEIDLAFAKAEFAREYDGCIPQFGDPAGSERSLWLKGVRHPLLEKVLRGQKRRPVPMTLELKEPQTLMVISGPNTGGKTVALKTLGIAVLMAQAGLPVAAEEARLPVFGRVLADIGDQQSIQANLSTFSAHIANIQAMLELAEQNDLVLMDEIGASTEPSEGAALAVAILERFRALGAVTLVTTHHSRLKAYAAEAPQAVNAAMEFDEATLQPTYRLLTGLPGKSSALDIAGRLGLEPSVVEKARALLHSADAQAAALIEKLHEQSRDLEGKAARLEQERKELEAREAALELKFEQERRAKLKELDARLEETLRQVENRLQSAIADLASRSRVAEAGKKLGRKAAVMKAEAREEWNAQVLETLGAAATEEITTEAPPAVGDRVHVASLAAPGKVIARLDDDHLEVEVGRLRMRVRKEEIRVIAGGKVSAPQPLASVTAAGDVPAELNVIGNTAEEARERVDKFLDQAYLAGRFRLRIVHGHGKGILRKTLHEMLATHPHVEKFDPAPPQEGGAGATIVELKM
jgi:DNA mismatch repair protein MutS2